MGEGVGLELAVAAAGADLTGAALAVAAPAGARLGLPGCGEAPTPAGGVEGTAVLSGEALAVARTSHPSSARARPARTNERRIEVTSD